MAFYGRNNVTDNTSFKFDRIYSNRVEMDTNAPSDGIFLNRYVLIEYSGTDQKEYKKNWDIDAAAYSDMDKGYDGTVWMKTSIHTDDGNEKIKYVQIAELNSVVPTLNIKVVAPSLTAKQVSEQKNISIEELPGFDETNSTNIAYDLYMRPIWQFTKQASVEEVKETIIKGEEREERTNILVSVIDDDIISNDLEINGKTNKKFTFDFPIIGNMFTKLYEILYGGIGDKKDNPDKDTPMGIANDFNNIEKNQIPYKTDNDGYKGFTFEFNTDSGISFNPNEISDGIMKINVTIDSGGVWLDDDLKDSDKAEFIVELLKLSNSNDIKTKTLTDFIITMIEKYQEFETDILNKYQEVIVSNEEQEQAYNNLFYNYNNWVGEGEAFSLASSDLYQIGFYEETQAFDGSYPIESGDTLNTALAKLEGQIANNTIDQVFVINEENAENLPAVIENKLVFIESENNSGLVLETQENNKVIEKEEKLSAYTICPYFTTTEAAWVYLINDDQIETNNLLYCTKSHYCFILNETDWIELSKINKNDNELDVNILESIYAEGQTYTREWGNFSIGKFEIDNSEGATKLKNKILEYAPNNSYIFLKLKEEYVSNFEEPASLQYFTNAYKPDTNYGSFYQYQVDLYNKDYISLNQYSSDGNFTGNSTVFSNFVVTFNFSFKNIYPIITFNNCNILSKDVETSDSLNYITSNNVLDFNNCRIQSLSLGSIPLKGYEIIEEDNYSLPVVFNNCEIFNFNNLVKYVASDLSLKQTAGYDISFINSTINNSIIQASASKITMEDSVFNNCEFSSATSSYEGELVYKLTGDSTTYYKTYRFNNKKVTYNNCLLKLGSSMSFGEYKNEHLTFINSQIYCYMLPGAAWPTETYRTFMGCSGNLHLTNNVNTLYNHMKPQTLNDLNNFSITHS